MVGDSDSEVEIVVNKIEIDGCIYLETEEGVILDSNSYEVLDIKK